MNSARLSVRSRVQWSLSELEEVWNHQTSCADNEYTMISLIGM